MRKWIGKNLAALLVFLAASFYFFGELRIEVRSAFLHTTNLRSTYGYPELSLIGFHPLFGYVLWLGPALPMGLYLYTFLEINRWNWHTSVWRTLLKNKLQLAILLGLFTTIFQNVFLDSLRANLDLTIAPGSANFQELKCLGWFLFWVAFLLPVALTVAYFQVGNQILPILHVQLTSKTVIAVVFWASVVNFLFFVAEFTGFLDASQAREIFINKTDEPELKNKRLFLLDQNESLYAILTSAQPGDKRAVVFVKKDKYPIISLGNSVQIMQPIGKD